jgi:Transposase DNA-binding/Transposase Tn5 dimerisation domain
MARSIAQTESWAREEFGTAALGDARRTARLVQVVARAAAHPSGKLSEVFQSARELDAAYDFVERDQTSVERLQAAVGLATVRSCEGPYVFVPVDGSSVNLTDRTGKKGFGSIGSLKSGASGLKVMNALAVGADGVTLGVLAQSWWARKHAKHRTAKQKKRDSVRRKTDEKETRYWLDTIAIAAERLNSRNARAWFQLDREGDAWPTLLKLSQSGHLFTVRSAWDRVLETVGVDKEYVRAKLAASAAIGSYELVIPRNGARKARHATMTMHAVEVTLVLLNKETKKREPLRVNVVWVHELGTPPSGEMPLNWMLFTNAPIDTIESARRVVFGYSLRWRIEEFHKTWKTGECNIELTQLRSFNAIVRWATILAVVAARIERLKRLGRTEPERLATDALTPIEIEVLVVLKRETKKRTENVPDGIPTIGNAVRWLADLGGYMGKSSGGPPGSITIGRGLQRVRDGAKAVLAMRAAGK